MAYIANRPVRFDRDYAIGEIIPESVIDPRMTAKLEGMGKIIRSDIPAAEQTMEEVPSEVAGTPADGDEEAEGTNIPEETENEGAEFKCKVCGKTFKTANALSAHSRIHKK